MILKASQRGGATQLALHLLKTEENEHVEVHEVSGFIAEDILGALREAQAVSKGTRCRQFLFHVALNPPQTEQVRVEVFEDALNHINGIENFWNQAKRHLRKFNGVPKAHFGLFLKECEWRFNNSDPSAQLAQLRQWVKRHLR